MATTGHFLDTKPILESIGFKFLINNDGLIVASMKTHNAKYCVTFTEINTAALQIWSNQPIKMPFLSKYSTNIQHPQSNRKDLPFYTTATFNDGDYLITYLLKHLV